MLNVAKFSPEENTGAFKIECANYQDIVRPEVNIIFV